MITSTFMIGFSTLVMYTLAIGFCIAVLRGEWLTKGCIRFYRGLIAVNLIAIAVFGLFQAVFMANAGGCWDNAKKIVEVDLQEKGTPLHEATVVGDTVGDPFKDTSSVAMNPIIKFTTLFGLLAMEIAISESFRNVAPIAGWIFLVIALIFVIRSFYAMRIPVKSEK